jgi:hypothetical protein
MTRIPIAQIIQLGSSDPSAAHIGGSVRSLASARSADSGTALR